MTSVFLSYAHEDQSRATRIAQALEKAGHHVWWDRNIRAGRRFSVEIDEALTAAEWVVVLWSKTSIVSPWVQDEAAVGRDSGRLMPALLDPVVPPLGFRQYQTIGLGITSRKNIDDAVRPLLDALPKPSDAPITSHSTPAFRRRLPRLQPILAAILLGITLGGGGLWWWRSSATSGNTVSITAAAGADPVLSPELARQAVIDLGRFPASLASLSFDTEEGETAAPAAYRSTISAQRDHDILHVDISMMVRSRPGIAWATTIDGRADHLVDLRQQIAAYLSAALGCASRYGAPAEKLSNEVYRSFLTGCVGMEHSDGPLANMTTFKNITAKAPEFGPGWASLAVLEVQNIADVPDAERSAFIAEMRIHLAKAKQLAPNFEETLAADALIRRPDDRPWAHSLPKLDKAIQRIPNGALLLKLRANGLQSVGRMDEAVESMRRALSVTPLAPDIRSEYVSSLAFSGQRKAAEAELSKAEAIWPESDNIRIMRYIFDLRYGDPRVALELLETDQTGGNVNVSLKKSWQTFLTARIDPSSANIERTLASFRERYRRDPADIPGYAQALGTFGRTDEFFEAARNPVTLDSMTVSTETLFRTHMKPILHDPRFIDLANRLGLLDFWRSSHAWPDFCQDPDLPYDCRKEASKYR